MFLYARKTSSSEGCVPKRKMKMKSIPDFYVPYKPLKPERKAELESVLRSSCRLLELHHNSAKSMGYKGSRRRFFADAMRTGGRVAGLSIPECDMAKIGQIKDLEWEVLCAHSRLISKMSMKMSVGLDVSFSCEDVQSVAMEGFLMAICCFTREEIKFSTYLGACLTRRIMDAKAVASNSMAVPRKIVKLRHKLKKAMSEGASMDSAISSMHLSKKTEKMLVSSMLEAHNTSSSGVKEREFVLVEAPQIPTETLQVSSAGMSELEREVLEEFMRLGEDMNLSAISRRLKNPKTGKNYSRMALSLAWKRVRCKMSSSYGKVA